MRLSVALCLAAALWAHAVRADPIVATPRPLSDAEPPTRLGEVEVLGVLQLTAPQSRWFGGLSGLEFDSQGRMVAIEDVGHWARFRLHTDEDGRPLGVSDLSVENIGGLDGSKEDGDAEEVVATRDGWIVSFEHRHRLRLYRGEISDPGEPFPAPDEIAQLPENQGIEAATSLADGRLLLIAEDPGADGWSPAWIGGRDGWQKLEIAYSDHFHPTAAATLPNGDVLVLQRRFTWLSLSARLVLLKHGDLVAGARVSGHMLMQLDPPLLVDNYEGLALKRRADGRMVAYMVSDDNFNPLQATLLMAVLLP